MPLADISPGTILILIVLVALPIGAFVFARGAGQALEQVGKGDLSIGDEAQAGGGGSEGMTMTPISSEIREEEIRQMVQARSDRAEARGEEGFDVDAEVERLLAPERGAGSLGGDKQLREEVRQLVVARNERRERQGKAPLDVDAETDRQLRDLENLGQ